MKKAATAPCTRQLTICNKAFPRQGGHYYLMLPVIVLTGKWLQQQGFKSGQVIDIACEEGKLTITIAARQRFEIV